MVIIKFAVLTFFKDRAVKFDSTKVGETDTRQPPLYKTSCMLVGGTGLMYVDM